MTKTVLLLLPLVTVISLPSCAPKVLYSLKYADHPNTQKIYFGQNKDVITSGTFRWHSGTYFIDHDFSFDKKLVVNIAEAKVQYKNYELPFNFIGKNIKKDTLHIDGDDNLMTILSIPFKLQIGDTLTLKLDNFLHDEDGIEYPFEPIYLIVQPFSPAK